VADKEIKDFDAVATPALADVLVCQQAGVTAKQTVTQIFSNIANLAAASALDGTETVFTRQGGINVKMTVDALAEFIIENS
jgi:hypothetical protein